MILNLPIWPYHKQQTSKWVSPVHHHYKKAMTFMGVISHICYLKVTFTAVG